MSSRLNILISPGVWDPKPWKEGLSKSDSIGEVHVWPTAANLDEVEMLLVWQPLPAGVIARLPNLKLISSMGAGVDHLLGDPHIPLDIPVMRIVDQYLAIDMTNYVLMSLLIYQRNYHQLIENQQQSHWDRLSYAKVKVGILGLGALGSHLANQLVKSGFEVYGYSRSAKEIEGVQAFHGEQLDDFLARSQVLVNLLPLNDFTQDILNYELLSKLPKGGYLINVARGKHLVDNDLIKLLDEQHLTGAVLDVFREEPLPADHPFWQHEKITITPHVASVTTPHSAINLVLENAERFLNKLPLKYLANLERQY